MNILLIHINYNMRLGYACINETLKDKYCVNKTCRLSTILKLINHEKSFEENSLTIYNFLISYCTKNLEDMYYILSWNRKHGIFFYRMSSDMFPHINNPKVQKLMTKSHWQNYISLNFAYSLILTIGKYAQKYGIRLTMHPEHFVQLASPNEDVLSNTITDLAWHCCFLDILETGAEYYISYSNCKDKNNESNKNNIIHQSILCLHGGGTYKNKKETLLRWEKNFLKLPQNIQRRICLENCERGYCVEDLLPLCIKLGIPLIFDFHHYACYPYYHKDEKLQKPINELLPEILSTWKSSNNYNRIPKFHLSDQCEGKRIGAHHDYVEKIPDELITLYKSGYKFDIMIEAKKKELATLKLLRKYDKILNVK